MYDTVHAYTFLSSDDLDQLGEVTEFSRSLLYLDGNNQLGKGEIRMGEKIVVCPGEIALKKLPKYDRDHAHEVAFKHGRFKGSLQGFQVLKTLRVEYGMFSGGQGRAHRIVDVMSASVESSTLAGPIWSCNRMANVLEGLAEHKAKKASKLEKVVYEGYEPLSSLGTVPKLFSKGKEASK